MNELFGTKQLIDQSDLIKLIARLAFDLVFATIVVRLIYMRLYRNREYAFTYFLFNIVTFCMCLLLRKVPMELGFALGLFAVFGILRYRTEAIRIRDLTYLFIVIGLGLLNALSNKNISVAELLVVNVCIVGATALLELRPGRSPTERMPVLFDNLLLLRPANRPELIRELELRLGVTVESVEIHRVDLLRDVAEITVVHSSPLAVADPVDSPATPVTDLDAQRTSSSSAGAGLL